MNHGRRLLSSSGLLLLIMVLCFSGALSAKEKGVFKGIDRFSGDTDGKKMFMEGSNLEYFQGETYIRFVQAEIVEQADGSREVTFMGNVSLQHEDLYVTGDKFCYNTDKKSGIFSGEVVLKREETLNDQGEVEKEGIKLVCNSLLLHTEEKTFIAREKPFIEHKDFQGSGEEIRYLDAEELLTIVGDLQIQKGKEEIKGEEICFNLKHKTFEAKRGAEPLEMIFEIEEKEEKSSREEEESISDPETSS